MRNLYVKISEKYLKFSDKLLTRLDDDLDTHLKLSINFSLYVIAMLLLSPLLIGTEKVICFSVFYYALTNMHVLYLQYYEVHIRY